MLETTTAHAITATASVTPESSARPKDEQPTQAKHRASGWFGNRGGQCTKLAVNRGAAQLGVPSGQFINLTINTERIVESSPIAQDECAPIAQSAGSTDVSAASILDESR
jgi:hypothetical protein